MTLDEAIYRAIRHYTAAHGDDEMFVAELKLVFKEAGYALVEPV